MSSASKAVFLSYASQDAEPARRICDALRAANVEVWFDQSELRGGDAWDQKIRRQIKECALFVPLVSANTQARREGYFRLEWKLADDRTHLMARGTPFLLPVCIDDTKDWDAIVPDSFTLVQWIRLPGGQTSPAFIDRVKALLSSQAQTETARPHPVQPGEGAASPPKPRHARAWLVPAVIGMAALVAVAIWQPWRKSAPSETKASAPLSEAAQLVAKARQIVETSDELNRENYFLAEDLVKRAVGLEPANAPGWALWADISFQVHWHGLDDSEIRRDALRRQAERARSLDPQLTEAQIAFANMRILLRQDLPGVERDLLALEKREPGNWRVQNSLGLGYRLVDRIDDAIRAMQRAHELSNTLPRTSADLANILLRRNRFAEAEAVLAQALRKGPTGRLLAFDLIVRTQWRGDLASAAAALADWPDWLLVEDRGAILAMRTWLWSRQPEKVLVAARRLSRDFLRDWRFIGPRTVFTARAHEVAGQVEAAQADWRTVVQLCDRQLTATPGDPQALYWKAWALARLGDRAGAESICTQMEQRNMLVSGPGTPHGVIDVPHLLVTVGRIDQAIADLRTRRSKYDQVAVTRAELELDPAFEPLRTDPRYQELLQLVPAPDQKAAAAQPSENSAPAKSVAVLAFSNLSDDKGNEYFSDGISEELLNVLAKVPGLKVTARTSAFHFKGKDTPITEIAKQLGVAYVVEGSVRKSGNRVRITAQLIKAADGFHVWSENFDRELKDIFAVQDEIAGLIAKNLALKLGTGTASAPVSSVQTMNLAAYDAYLRARALQTGGLTIPLQRDTVRLYEEAVQTDDGYALAWARLAQAHVWLISHGPQDRSEPNATNARKAARTAVQLAPDLPEARLAMAGIFLHLDRDHDATQRELDAAERLQANNPEVFAMRARLEFARGKWGAGLVDLVMRSIELDPQNAEPHDFGTLILSVLGRFAEADQLCRRWSAIASTLARPIMRRSENHLAWTGDATEALAIIGGLIDRLSVVSEFQAQNRVFRILEPRAAIYEAAGDFPSAIADYERIRDASRRFGAMNYRIARLEAKRGNLARAVELRAEVLAYLQERRSENPEDPSVMSMLALVHAARQEKSEAMTAMQKAMQLEAQSRDASRAANLRESKAEMLATLGELDAAVAELRALHEMGWGFGYRLRRAIEWEPLRGNTRFQQLMKDAEARADAQPRPKK